MPAVSRRPSKSVSADSASGAMLDGGLGWAPLANILYSGQKISMPEAVNVDKLADVLL
jgi:hypothetical protein